MSRFALGLCTAIGVASAAVVGGCFLFPSLDDLGAAADAGVGPLGAPTIIASQVHTYAIIADDTNIYWQAAGSIFAKPLTGDGAARQITSGLPTTSHFAVDGDAIYVA